MVASGASPLLIYRWLSSYYIFTRKRQGLVVSSVSLLVKALIPSWGLHPHDFIDSQRHHLQYHYVGEYGFSIWILEGYSQLITRIANLEGCKFYIVKESSNLLKVVRAISTSLWIQFHLELLNLMVTRLIFKTGWSSPHFLVKEMKAQRTEALLWGPKLETVELEGGPRLLRTFCST